MEYRINPQTAPMILKKIEYCINRGNAAVVKVEHGDMIIMEEQRKILIRDKDEKLGRKITQRG